MFEAGVRPFPSQTHYNPPMKRNTFLIIVISALLTSAGLASQADGPYKVLKTANVGGEGGTDYIFADVEGRRLYITRGATPLQRVAGFTGGAGAQSFE